MILVVVDRRSKFAQFIALVHPFTASVVADKFMKRIHTLYGLPESIVSE